MICCVAGYRPGVWQDEYTNGASPLMLDYQEINREFAIYLGPINGWFATYRKTSLALCRGLPPGRDFAHSRLLYGGMLEPTAWPRLSQRVERIRENPIRLP